jgi:hypothetical protein
MLEILNRLDLICQYITAWRVKALLPSLYLPYLLIVSRVLFQKLSPPVIAAYTVKSNTELYSTTSANINLIIQPPSQNFPFISKLKVFPLIRINLSSIQEFLTGEWSKAGYV